MPRDIKYAKIHLIGLRPNNVDEFYIKNFNRWLLLKSSKVKFNERLIENPIERIFLMLPKNENGEPQEGVVEISETTSKGYELYEDDFIHDELIILTPLYNEIEKTTKTELRKQLKQYIDFLNQRKEQIEKINTPKEQPQSEQSNDKTTTGNQPPHFNGDYTDEELTATFEKLKKGKYIHSESDLDSWIYLCTGREEKAFTEPINWTKSGVLLGMFVQYLFNDTDKKAIWEITAKCFTVKGKTPNTNSIKVSLSKIKQNCKNRPKDYDKMKNEIINDIT